jgi:hypothetical protein
MINFVDGKIRGFLPEVVRTHLKSLSVKFDPQNKEWYLDKKLSNYDELVVIINDYLEKYNVKEEKRINKLWIQSCRYFGLDKVSKSMDEYEEVKKHFKHLIRQ